jgi:hypothetical protein
MSDWLPIETAPKSDPNHDIEVCRVGGGATWIAHWHNGAGDDYQPPVPAGWYYRDGDGYREVWPAPTHWRELQHATQPVSNTDAVRLTVEQAEEAIDSYWRGSAPEVQVHAPASGERPVEADTKVTPPETAV